ncbi:hypothetical protein HED50_21275 [Ochrobactrum oryzae]|nr:hypothetical protein [Brucella oryzae]
MRVVQGIALFAVALLILSATPASHFTLAMVLGFCFLVDGSVRIGSAWVVRYPRWRLGLMGGIAEVCIAIATLQPWPTWYAGTVAFNVGAVMILTSLGILNIATRVRRLEEGASISSIFNRNPLWNKPGSSSLAHSANRSELIVHVWTPTGQVMTPLHQRAINRYIAAVDTNGVISTGHAALEMAPNVYISHYPAVEIDRSPDEFTGHYAPPQTTMCPDVSCQAIRKNPPNGANRQCRW